MLIEAHAKINWTLEVLGVRQDGYHALRSVVVSVPLHDDVILEPCDRIDASALAYGTDDLACRAAAALAARTGCTRGVSLRVTKRIPAGGGLGGGSADAAAVLRGLNDLWQLDLPLRDLLDVAASVGSDVPALLLGGCVMMEGRGEVVRPLTAEERRAFRVPDPTRLVIRDPGFAVSTREVFAAFRPEDRGLGRNDLQPAALRLHPKIAESLRCLNEEGLGDVAMTGSGACVYGVRP